jgi:peptidoglycan/LPS O-acetylase OafA/YrhL
MVITSNVHVPVTAPQATVKSSSDGDAAAKQKKVRIVAFDSMRFFLCMGIVLGHFIKFANPSDFIFKLCSQHNVIVGFFFALSGYVTAYTSTENAQRKASSRLTDTPAQQWILQRVFGYFPLHAIVLLLFAPMFLYADVSYNGWPIALWNGLLSLTLTQAWFPFAAEIWNAPTWFLSALTVATALMPFGLPKIAHMDKKGLRRTAVWLYAVSLLGKIGYCYDFKAWTLVEGVMAPKAHPNIAAMNMMRFNPLLLAAEVFLGAVACRLVMLDAADGETPVKTNSLSTLVPLAALIGLFYVRASGLWNISDLLVRSAICMPLFLRFAMAAHRNTVARNKDLVVSFLSHPILVWLGNLTFPIYIVHGPIGQVFFKKIIATKLFGKVLMGPQNFGLYLASLLVAAIVLQKTVLQSKLVADASQSSVNKLSKWF